jgi:hypothetical protein
MKITPKQRELLKRHVSIDGDGNVVGNDNTVRVTKQEAGDYAVQIGEQVFIITIGARRELIIKDSRVGVIGDFAHIEGGIHQHKHEHYHSDTPPPVSPKPEGRCDYYRHIPLPPHYVPRPEVVDATRAALLESADGIALTSAIQQTPEALHGMGGIGKTVVARALCDDPEMQEAFPDGILWTTLGREVTDAALRSKLREWIDALGGIVSETAPTLDRLKGILAQLLEDRACLLIVDDVWRRTHAEAFQIGGPRCCLLITTRDAEVARGLGARLHPVDVMAREQAVALLEQWADGELDDVTDDIKDQIVERVGCLPLAVKLAGEQLRRHDPTRWLERFDARKLQSPRPETVHDSLFQTFSLSLEDLTEEVSRCYTALTIFPEDEPVPIVALDKLWGVLVGLDEDRTRDLMYDLAARALVQLDETPVGPAVTLHDLLRDFIADELGEQGAQDAHRALLDAYRATKEDEGWHTAPDDGYLYDYLAYHLNALADHDGEAANELHELFASDAWLHARVPADDYRYDGYLTDLALLWQWVHEQASEQIEAGKPACAIAESVHCALIQTTVNSLATNYMPELVARAVETGLWSPARGVSVLRRIAEPVKQIKTALTLLASGALSERRCIAAKSIGLSAARAIEDAGWRAWAFVELVPYMEDELLVDALTAIHAIEDGRQQTRILVTLATQLGGGAKQQTLVEMLATAREIEDANGRAEVLAALAPHLEEELRQQALAEELTFAREIEDANGRAEVLAALAPQLEGDLLSEGLAAAREVDEWWRAKALTALVPKLEGELLVEGLAAAREMGGRRRRVEVLAALAPKLKGEARQRVLTEGLDAARSIGRKEERALALATLAPQLKGELRQQVLGEALDALHAIEHKENRALALAALIPHLSVAAIQPILAEALDLVRMVSREFGSPDCQARVLVKLAPHLEGKLLTDALIDVRSIGWGPKQAEVLMSLAPQLENDLLAEALDIARGIDTEYFHAEALAALAPHLEGELLAEALDAVCEIEDEEHWAETLIALAPHQEGKLTLDNLDAVRTIRDGSRRARVLGALAPHLKSEMQKQALAEGLTAIHKIERDIERAQALAVLAPQLDGDLLASGVTAARTIEDPLYRVKALAEMAPDLDDEGRRRIFVEELNAAYAIESEWKRAGILEALAPYLDEELLKEGLTAVLTIEYPLYRAEALAGLVPRLDDKVRRRMLAKGLSAVHMSEWEPAQANALVTLAPYLNEELLVEGLSAALTIKEPFYRARALAGLVPRLDGEARQRALAVGLDTVRAIDDEMDRKEILAALTLHLVGEERRQILIEFLDIAIPHYDSEILGGISSHLDSIAQKEAFAESVATSLLFEDYVTLSALIKPLEGKPREYLLSKLLAYILANDDELDRIRWIPYLEGGWLRQAREMLSQKLWSYRERKREDLLAFLAYGDCAFLRAFDLPPEAYDRIAQSIIDICTRWEWL